MVATQLSEFLTRYDAERDGFWTASLEGRIEGSITIDAADAHCRARRYARVHLWTFEGLHAARHLYDTAGFRLVEQRRGSQWGTEVTEQKFALVLP